MLIPKNPDDPSSLRGEVIPSCELHGFAQRQVTGPLLQRHVSEAPLVSFRTKNARNLLENAGKCWKLVENAKNPVGGAGNLWKMLETWCFIGY